MTGHSAVQGQGEKKGKYIIYIMPSSCLLYNTNLVDNIPPNLVFFVL